MFTVKNFFKPFYRFINFYIFTRRTGEDFSDEVQIPKPDGMMERAYQFVKWLDKENPQGGWGHFLTEDGSATAFNSPEGIAAATWLAGKSGTVMPTEADGAEEQGLGVPAERASRSGTSSGAGAGSSSRISTPSSRPADARKIGPLKAPGAP